MHTRIARPAGSATAAAAPWPPDIEGATNVFVEFAAAHAPTLVPRDLLIRNDILPTIPKKNAPNMNVAVDVDRFTQMFAASSTVSDERGPRSKVTVTHLEPLRRFDCDTRFPGAVIHFEHELRARQMPRGAHSPIGFALPDRLRRCGALLSGAGSRLDFRP